MSKKRIIIIAVLSTLLLVLAGAALWFQLSIPPGEEWIAYENEAMGASIDRQLEGMNMERLAADYADLVPGRDVLALQQAVKRGALSYEDLTAICLYRIKTLDQGYHGYNSVIEVAPDAILQARARDRIAPEAGTHREAESRRRQEHTGRPDRAAPQRPHFSVNSGN